MIGQTISHYKIIEKLGEGGMGDVYKAEDLKLHRTVALKFLPVELTSDEEAKNRFIWEAQAASSLQHNNICTIHEIDETEDGQLFITMDYYDGETLKDKICKESLSIEEIINLTIQIGEGLNKAHEKGIIHRDIKPSNILITKNNQVKIVDFGIAKQIGNTKITKKGSTLGTIAYMSPEQIENSKVDFRTDIWSFGVLLYEMATGQLPFKHEYETALIYAIVNKTPVPLTDLNEKIPIELEHTIYKCLQKEKEYRYQTVRELLIALEKVREIVCQENSPHPEQPYAVSKEMERKHLTILSAGILSIDALNNKLLHEEIVIEANRCLENFCSIAQKHRGEIYHSTTSTVVIIFGMQATLEDSTKYAVNTALEIKSWFGHAFSDSQYKESFELRIGIESGAVIVGVNQNKGRLDYSIFGSVADLADKMRDEAQSNQICISENAAHMVKNEFHFKQINGNISIGKSSLPIYEITSQKQKIYRPVLGVDRKIYSELVGRAKELNQLRFHLLKVINGKGAVINIIGDAGIGKSRLITELQKNTEIDKVICLYGNCLSNGKNRSFHPIQQIFKNWANIRDDDSDRSGLFKLKQIIDKYYPQNSKNILPFIAPVAGISLTDLHEDYYQNINSEILNKLVIKSLKEFLSAAAEKSAIVWIMEDMHWADLSTVEVMESLYAVADENPILFINLFRPHYQEISGRLLRTIQNRYPSFYSEINLGLLEKSEAETMAKNLLKITELPYKLKTFIAEKTEGNPLFIEELIHSLIDAEAIKLENGEFKITEKMQTVDIPENIHEMLMMRIDKLDDETRQLLKIASVIGKSFYQEILVEVAGSIEDITERLLFLKQIQLISEQKQSQEKEYSFNHILVQQVIYESILTTQRKMLHLSVAKAISKVFASNLQNFWGVLAYHYCLGEDFDQAEKYLVLAGKHSLKASASSEALYFFKETLSLYNKKYGNRVDVNKIIELEKNIAEAFIIRGQHLEAIEHLDKVHDLRGIKIPHGHLVLYWKTLYIIIKFNLYLFFPIFQNKRKPTPIEQDNLSIFFKKITVLTSVNAKRFFFESIFLLGMMLKFGFNRIEHAGRILAGYRVIFSSGSILNAIGIKTLALVKQLTDPDNDIMDKLVIKTSDSFNSIVTGTLTKSMYDQCLVDQALQLGEIFYVCNYLHFNSVIQTEFGKFDISKEITEKLGEIAKSYDYDFAYLKAYRGSLMQILKCRKLNDLLKVEEKFLPQLDKVGDNGHDIFASGIKARILLLSGEFTDAVEKLKKADKDISSSGIKHPIISSHFFLGQFYYYLIKLENLKKDDRIQLKKLRKQSLRWGKKAVRVMAFWSIDQVEVFRLMGTYYWLTVNQKSALSWWTKSIDTAKKLNTPPELARTYLEVAKRLGEPGSSIYTLSDLDINSYLTMAYNIFMKLNLEWDLAELEKVRSLKNKSNNYAI